MKIIIKITIISLLLLGGSSYGQQKKWTLEECIAYALENNISIQQSELDLKVSDIEKMEAIGNFLPNITGSANYGINTGANINPATNQFENQSFRSASANINTGINLFNGLVNWKNLQRVKINKMANEYRLSKMKDDIMLTIANSYLQILFNKEQVKVLENQLKITNENITRTKQQIDAGSLPAGDIYELLATAAAQEQQIIAADNTLLISKLGLAQTLLLKDYANFDIVSENMDVPQTEILMQTPEAIATKAKEVVNDIKIASTNYEIAKKDVSISKAFYMPTLSGFVGYNTRWSQSIPIGFVDQLSIFDGTNIGVQLNVPVLNGFTTRARVARSKINEQRSKLLLEQAELDLERTVFQAYNDMINAQKSYQSAVKTLEARQLAQNFSKERFEVGLLNSFDYSQALVTFENAQSEVIRTKYDYIFRIKVLEFYFGIPISKQ